MGLVATQSFSEQLAHASDPIRPKPCRSGRGDTVSTNAVEEDDRGTMLKVDPSTGYVIVEEEASSSRLFFSSLALLSEQ
jgi:hypothetical protein